MGAKFCWPMEMRRAVVWDGLRGRGIESRIPRSGKPGVGILNSRRVTIGANVRERKEGSGTRSR